jgi:L-asparaginase/N4-(beta-N-acetylglucosaminyl)-L-asparaginase
LRGVDADRHRENESHNAHHDTVGVLARDAEGTLASACSTSGMAFKVPGRVGDSPIIGHGLYTQPGVGCAVATGAGELLMGVCASFLAVERIRAGDSPADATRRVIERIGSTFEIHPRHQAVVLAMNARGEWAAAALRPGFRAAVMTPDHNEPALIESQWIAIPDDPKQSKHSML